MRLSWVCEECDAECAPVRAESRCLCGHRFKEHAGQDDSWRCRCRDCCCPGFDYIFAQGAWILRCSCKHKHTDHAPDTKQCRRCPCTNFFSPFVCNCDHGWSCHKQQAVAGGGANNAADLTGAVAQVNRWDLLRRGEAEKDSEKYKAAVEEVDPALSAVMKKRNRGNGDPL